MSSKDKDQETSQDWERLRYPDRATFERMLKDHADDVYDGEKNDYRVFHALPAWIRLGWPSQALWDRVARTKEIEDAKAQAAAGARVSIPQPWPGSRLAWVAVLALYPERKGVPEEEQDAYRMLRFWPDCFGQPMVEVEVTLVKDVITINDMHYPRGPHRVPKSVAVDIRRMCHDSTAELIKAVLPKEHAEQILGTLSMKTG